jgi:hypothetical protein
MIRWEYHIVYIFYHTPEEIVDELDACGAEGWEVVSIDWGEGVARVFLKRIKEQG